MTPQYFTACFRLAVVMTTLISTSYCETPPPRLILITLDSMMNDFLKAVPAHKRTNFDRIKRDGVFAERILNVFPTSTYPNHYTLLTGLYPESHQLVANRFYDPSFNDFFAWDNTQDNVDSKWFDQGAEPIYVTNKKAGGNRRSGVVLFPTALAEVKGIAPDFMVEDDGTYPNTANSFPYVDMPYSDRVKTLVDWFTAEQTPTNLGLMYFPEPDDLAHMHGISSTLVTEHIGGPLNDALGDLFDQLEEHDLLDSTNIIVTSDHGHTDVTTFALLDEYVDEDSFTTGGESAIALQIYPKPGKEDELVANLSRCPDVHVYRKSGAELGAMNYTASDRIAPVVLIAKEGVAIVKNDAAIDSFPVVGLHGYDPVEYPSMRPLFMAMGPGFKKGVVSHQFNSVDVYPLMCHLLGVEPAPNNGSLDNVRHLLAADTDGGSERHVQSVLIVLAGVTPAPGIFRASGSAHANTVLQLIKVAGSHWVPFSLARKEG